MIRIVKASVARAHESGCRESHFLVESELILNLSGGTLGYEVVAVEPYKKTYPHRESDDESKGAGVSFLAHSGSRFVGRIDLSRSWNDFAYVNYIVVELAFRRTGVGTALMQQAIEWSQAERLAGVMLETQNNNVAACKLYERCGFRLSGFDQDLYRGRDPDTREVALFWYWHSQPAPAQRSPNIFVIRQPGSPAARHHLPTRWSFDMSGSRMPQAGRKLSARRISPHRRRRHKSWP